MTFISYSQNFEDVILGRALKDIENGFYIDVGANDHIIDSVTKAFYDRGWRGINIEPLQSHCDVLKLERPRDINICCAAGEVSGEVEIFECDIRGWATAEKEVVDKLIEEGHEGTYHSVPMRTLADICQEYQPTDIHFLKIDVEGMEKQVISGADFEHFRPWIIVIEATAPNSREEIHERWEELILSKNYHFAYADGLNRFYLADEHQDLASSFSPPPNVFDDFVLYQQINSDLRAQQAEANFQEAEARVRLAEKNILQSEARLKKALDRIQQMEDKLQHTEARAAMAEARAVKAEDEVVKAEVRVAEADARVAEADAKTQATEQILNVICTSHSWRITAPLRWLGLQVKLLRRHGLFARVSALAKRITGFFFSFINLYSKKCWSVFPQSRSICLKKLKDKNIIEASERHLHGLTPKAHKIYTEINAIIKRKKELH